jgi:hypothetical protein
MDGLGILFLILTLLLIGLLVFIKFTKIGQSFICPACPVCPSGQRIGLKYKSTDDKIVNNVINSINNTMDSVQNKYMTCDSISNYIDANDIPAKGTKCDDFRKELQTLQFPSGQEDIDKAQKDSLDSFVKEACLSDGTIDHDKLAASSKILQKTFCV